MTPAFSDLRRACVRASQRGSTGRLRTKQSLALDAVQRNFLKLLPLLELHCEIKKKAEGNCSGMIRRMMQQRDERASSWACQRGKGVRRPQARIVALIPTLLLQTSASNSFPPDSLPPSSLSLTQPLTEGHQEAPGGLIISRNLISHFSLAIACAHTRTCEEAGVYHAFVLLQNARRLRPLLLCAGTM